LRPMDDSGPEVSLTLMGRPDGKGGAVMTVFHREDQARCLKAFLDGKHMHFGVDASDGEELIRLPLPNDGVFRTEYREVLDRVQAANDPAPMSDLSVRIAESHGFNTNEFVVYPAHGVGQILAIEEQEVAGVKLELFVINFMKDKMTLRVPTAKVTNVGMRKLSDPALVKRALETLKGSKQFQSSEWSSRAQEYDAKINSGDIVSIAEVVRDLYRLESQPEQSYSERQLYEAALDRLSREIAVVQHMTEAEAIREIEAYLADETPTSKQRAGVSPAMQGNAWKTIGSGHEYTLSRTYSTPRGAATTLEIICTVKSSREVNFVVSDLRFRFKPFRLERKGSLVLGLFTDEPKGALVEVEAIPVSEESRTTMLDVVMSVHREDAHKLLRALASGDDLHFALTNPAPPEEKPFLSTPLQSLAYVLLANDDAFKDLYEETIEKVSVCQDATRARQLGEGWYRRRTPGRDAE